MGIKVFISSRFKEFDDLRKSIVTTIRKHDSSNIEVIDLNDNQSDVRSPVERSMQCIEESDYVIFLLGETYGNIPDGYDKSHIHLEYEKAHMSKKDILLFTFGSQYINDKFSDYPKLAAFQKEILKNTVYAKFPSRYNINDVSKDVLQNLLDVVKKSRKSQKPQKVFNKVDDLLSIIFRKRKKIIPDTHKNKIRYEFWECFSPTKQYFLVFLPSAHLKNSIKHFLEWFKKEKKKLPHQITILKEKETKSSTTFEVLNENGIEVNEYTYSSFLWEFCIDQDFKEKKESVHVDKYYIDQNLYQQQPELKLESSMKIVKDFILEDSASPIMAIIAQAGIGKTTFLEKLTQSINRIEHIQCILIRSEDFKEQYDSTEIDKLSEITTIYDFYNAFIRLNNSKDLYHLDENVFNIGLFNGNIVIMIDGLDEIITLYQNKFNIESFLDSLVELNRQLGKCKIIISSRDYYWVQSQMINREEIITYKLKGFTEEHLENYLEKRFKEKNKQEIIKLKSLVKKHLQNIGGISEGKMHTPFVVELICSMAIEQLEDGEDSLESYINELYPNNNDTIDKIIYSILRREIRRQSFPGISEVDLLDIYITLATDYGEVISEEDFLESIQYKYPNTHEIIVQSLKFSPLLNISQINGMVSFKYDILKSYFIGLELIKIFSIKKANYCDTRHLAKLYKSENPIFKDIVKYFIDRKELFMDSAKGILKCLIEKYSKPNENRKEEIERSISSILYLLIAIYGTELSADKKIKLIDELYDSQNNKLDHLFIFGSFYSLDFSNKEVAESKFNGYSKFLNSKFNEKTKFIYTEFLNIGKSRNASDIKKEIFDETCELHELGYEIKEPSFSAEKIVEKTFKELYHHGELLDYRVKKKDINKILEMDCFEKNGYVEKDKQTVHYVYRLLESKKTDVQQYIQNGKIRKDLQAIVKCIKNIR